MSEIAQFFEQPDVYKANNLTYYIPPEEKKIVIALAHEVLGSLGKTGKKVTKTLEKHWMVPGALGVAVTEGGDLIRGWAPTLEPFGTLLYGKKWQKYFENLRNTYRTYKSNLESKKGLSKLFYNLKVKKARAAYLKELNLRRRHADFLYRKYSAPIWRVTRHLSNVAIVNPLLRTNNKIAKVKRALEYGGAGILGAASLYEVGSGIAHTLKPKRRAAINPNYQISPINPIGQNT